MMARTGKAVRHSVTLTHPLRGCLDREITLEDDLLFATLAVPYGNTLLTRGCGSCGCV